MFQIPKALLTKLKCNLCDGYLNAIPVTIKDGKQICAKCYKILPHDEKEQCIRQITFEAVGSCLVFPCRYHQMGCDYTYTWNNENGHETLCKKRYFTFPDVVTTDRSSNDLPSTHDQLNQNYINNNNSMAITSPTDPKIKGGKTNGAFNSDFTDEDQNRVNINIEGVVAFKNNKPIPALNDHSDHNPTNNSLIYENIYSTISNPSTRGQEKNTKKFKCLSCNVEVEKSTIYSCLFGHILCGNCKGDMCIACVKNLDGNSRIVCKNALKGCQELLYQNDVGSHRDNCEYNEILCPVDKCDKKHTLQQLIKHLTESHSNKIIMSNEITKNMGQKDKTLIFLCHGAIFKCLYFYYNNSIEVILVHLGPCIKASEHYFEMSVEVNKKVINKKLKCANWNNYMLASGLSLDKKELLINDEKPINLTVHLKIFKEH